jgi:glycosyltransferase involved in cell wall biosynthesis
MDASIIIVTRNRAEDLRQTLAAMNALEIPSGAAVELLVVDNGSTDGTAAVVAGCGLAHLQVRHVVEPQPGQSRGRNRGLAEARGNIVLFTDDDVRPPAGWIAGMCEPILDGRADAVAGGVTLAPRLLRPWMTTTHRSWLASTEWLERGKPQSMVGANMAFSKKVLERVPEFDPQVGPGALGFGDDGLFASQLLAAGFRIHDGVGIAVEHHFESSRLGREAWLSAARRRGESFAYIGHHWRHWACRWGSPRVMLAASRLAKWRSRNADKLTGDGCHEEEMELVCHHALVRQHLRESKLPRCYERHGSKKLQPEPA